MPAEAQQHPQVQADLNQAKGVVVQDAQKVIDNISKMPAQAQQHPQVQEKLAEAKKVVADHAPKPETQAGPPGDTQAREGPSSTGADQPQGTSATINGTTPPAGHVTPTAMEGQINPNQTSPQSQIPLPTTNNTSGSSKQPSTSPTLPPPSTPPQSVEKSQAIINNIMNRPPEARQHPQVQSDVTQAKQVVTDHVMKLENQHGPLSEGQKKALADAKTALALLAPEGNTGPQRDAGIARPASAQQPTQLGRTSPPQAALFDDVPGSSKTKEMRQKENEYLRTHTAASSTRPSKQIFTGSLDEHDLALQKAGLLMDSVHDGLGIRPVSMGRNVSSWRNAGEYNAATSIQPAQIHVSPDTATPLLTTLHELGHHVDMHLDPNDVVDVVKAAAASSSAGHIQDYIHKNKDYYLERDELWARAYAQYIALKSGDPEVMAELNSVLNNPNHSWKQWDKSDWIPIEEAIKKALKRRTWQ